ncbi:MAG: SnoaL-like domain [Thermomicrobiales bacterium]|jgi:ketosteroid isomerase-like protein|nr:SnoaL-like domain [Thermomicrobiales bacterium]
MTNDVTSSTRVTLELFYVAYTSGDLEGMLAMMADDVVVTFIGHGTFHGKAEAQPYMIWAGTQLPQLDFRVLHKIVDGERAAVVWDETGVTKRGHTWEAQGVDVYRIVDGKVVELTVHSDTEQMKRLLESWPPS